MEPAVVHRWPHAFTWVGMVLAAVVFVGGFTTMGELAEAPGILSTRRTGFPAIYHASSVSFGGGRRTHSFDALALCFDVTHAVVHVLAIGALLEMIARRRFTTRHAFVLMVLVALIFAGYRYVRHIGIENPEGWFRVESR